MTERKVRIKDFRGEAVCVNRCPVMDDGVSVGSTLCGWCVHFGGFKDSFEDIVLCEADDE